MREILLHIRAQEIHIRIGYRQLTELRRRLHARVENTDEYLKLIRIVTTR